MPKCNSFYPVINCPSDMVVVPYQAYESQKKQFHLNLKKPMTFSIDQRLGVPLKDIHALGEVPLDEAKVPLFEGCGTKVTFVINLEGYNPFKQQKYSHTRRDRESIPNNRTKVLRQVAEVLEAFIQENQNEKENPLFYEGGICLEDLYLLELRHVAKASFQPILAVKKERAFWDNSLMSSPSTGVNDNQYEDTYGRSTTVQCDYTYDNMAARGLPVMVPSEMMLPEPSSFPDPFWPFPPLVSVQ